MITANDLAVAVGSVLAATALYLGWSVIDAPSRHAAVHLLQDHPLLELGALLQINEAV